MRTVTIDKVKLLAKVRENRDKHEQEYLEAVKGWYQKVMSALQAAPETFASTQSMKYLNFGSDLPKPSSHTDEYDRVLQMIEWETGAVIELDETAFRHLVLDNWDWMSSFKMSSSRYTVD